jgi:hypothetical protein
MAASNAIGSGEGRSFRWVLRQVGDVALHHVGGALGVDNSLAKFVHFGDLCGAAIGGLGAASLNESPAPDVSIPDAARGPWPSNTPVVPRDDRPLLRPP